MKEIFKRYCPDCAVEIIYKTVSSFNKSLKYNTKCRKCSKLGIKSPFINKTYEQIYGIKKARKLKNKLSMVHIGFKHSKESKHKISINNSRYFLGKHLSDQHRENLKKNSGIHGTNFYDIWVKKHGVKIADIKMKKRSDKLSKSQQGVPKKKTSIDKMIKTKTGKPLSNIAKRNIRLGAIKRIEKDKFNGIQMMPGYNKNACKIIDEYSKKNGYSFQHAMNGGEFHIKELGYWVDGYDKDKNVVIEYYEKRHIKTTTRDEFRKQEIINHLGCKFIEIKEWENI